MDKNKTFKIHITLLHLMVLILSLASLLIFVLTTTPDKVGPVGISVFFVSLLVFLISLGYLVVNLLFGTKNKTSRIAVVLFSIIAVSAIALNTVELGIGDVVLFLLFAVTFLVYWLRVKSN